MVGTAGGGGGGKKGAGAIPSAAGTKQLQLGRAKEEAAAAATLAWEDARPHPPSPPASSVQGSHAPHARWLPQQEDEKEEEKGALDTKEAAQRRKVR